MINVYDFYEPDCITAMMLWLRRTLVQLEVCGARLESGKLHSCIIIFDE